MFDRLSEKFDLISFRHIVFRNGETNGLSVAKALHCVDVDLVGGGGLGRKACDQFFPAGNIRLFSHRGLIGCLTDSRLVSPTVGVSLICSIRGRTAEVIFEYIVRHLIVDKERSEVKGIEPTRT